MKHTIWHSTLILITGLVVMLGAYADTQTAPPLETINGINLRSMLSEDTRIEKFRHMDRIFPVQTIQREGSMFAFKESPTDLGAVPYEWEGETGTLEGFLDKTTTTNFLVIKDDTIVYERYFRGNTKESLATSWSVAKSFTSALVGIALEEDYIESVDDPITRYLPELEQSGYNGVPIKHILQMSSGIDFREVYDDPSSDTKAMLGRLAMGGSIVDYAASLDSQRKSGEAFNYASIDTNILGILIEETTGMSPAKYLEEKIWSELGMESGATWGTDNHGNTLSFGYLNATARDYAKFGRLYLNKGNWNGKQIVPAAWVEESVNPDQDYLKLVNPEGGLSIGYQYQWWVPAGTEDEFTGIGVWGQYVYVNPAHNLIIVKNSADPLFGERTLETIDVFRAISRHLADQLE
jgi:CubicO group peptidase (beta-lactamase class C family)